MHVFCLLNLLLFFFFDVLVAVAPMDLKAPFMYAYMVESLVRTKKNLM